MTIRIGYCCINTQLPSPNRTCRLERATPERLLALARENLAALKRILEWNSAHGILLFRISSETIPFGSHPVNDLPWWKLLQPELKGLGDFIRGNGLRVSLHPGQYTVLNSPRPEVAASSLAELAYHARLLDALGTDGSSRIILHGGGVYGDKAAALGRFAANFARLPESARQRLTLENDEKLYSLADLLPLAREIGVPVVFDVFHHAYNPSFPGLSRRELVELAATTWRPENGRQKLHYSDQWPGKPPGSHSQSVEVTAFLQFYEEIRGLPVDVMLEVKDKERSALAVMEAIAGSDGFSRSALYNH